MNACYLHITSRHVLKLAVLLMMLCMMAKAARADDARAFDARPEGEQWLEFFYSHSQASTSSDNLLPLVDIDASFDTAILQYRYYFSINAQSAFISFAVPQIELKAKQDTDEDGVPDPFGEKTREVGAGDPILMFAGSVFGRSRYREDWSRWHTPRAALGWSLAVTLPLGEYNQDAQVSAGNNRYVFHPQLNWSQDLYGPQLDVNFGASWFTDNEEYNDERGQETTLSQRMLVQTEAHLSDYFWHDFLWSLDLAYWRGGRARTLEKWKNAEINEWRFGMGLRYRSEGGSSFALVLERNLSNDDGPSTFNIGKLSYTTSW